MRMPALLLTVLVAVLLIAPANAEDEVNQPPQSKIEESAKSVQELQKERLTVLNELADNACNEFQSVMRVEEAVEACLMLSRAELEATENESERIASYRKLLARLNGLEEIALARRAAARGTTYTVLKVKALRLEAEINLERAKAKVTQGSK